jgi:hypothetical protein
VQGGTPRASFKPSRESSVFSVYVGRGIVVQM